MLQQRSQYQKFQHCLESEKNHVKILAPKYGYRLKSMFRPLWHKFLINVYFLKLFGVPGLQRFGLRGKQKGPYIRRKIKFFLRAVKTLNDNKTFVKKVKTQPFQNLASPFFKNYQNEFSTR